MAKQKKTRGRPATGVTPMMGFRATDELRAAIVKWAERQPDIPKLSEAVRRLVEIGLASQSSARVKSARATKRAREMAEDVVVELIGRDVTPSDRATRTRRLVKGPSMARDVRKDIKR